MRDDRNEIDAFPRPGGAVEYLVQDVGRGCILARGVLEGHELSDEVLRDRFPGLGARERAQLLARFTAVVRNNRAETFGVPRVKEHLPGR